MAKAAVVATNSVITPTATAISSELPELHPEVVEVVVLCWNTMLKLSQRRRWSGHSSPREARACCGEIANRTR